ncbi:MAG: FAD-binding oxidoreductase [Flavobacteriales bacterium]|nr:FAD-binding oxidoreductase [Flavobacteriales bacterium]
MGLSIWEVGGFHRKPHLVVIGGGIVGLFSALFHKRSHPGHHVVVLERGPHPSGASVKNAGFACFGSPSELLADIRNEGSEAALARVEERWRGLNELRAELGDANIGFEGSGGHEIYRTGGPLYPLVAEGFERLNAALRPIFNEPVFRWDDGAIGRSGMADVEHMVRMDLESAIDTGRMMVTLLRKVSSEGVHFRPGSDVLGMEDGSQGVRIDLRDGTRLEAGQVLIATNGYTSSLLPGLDVIPARGQVLLTEAHPRLGLVWNLPPW